MRTREKASASCVSVWIRRSLFMEVPVCECERGKKAKHNKHSAMRNPLSLRVGRFVDANEEESECKLCDREGFVTSSGIYYLPYPPCMLNSTTAFCKAFSTRASLSNACVWNGNSLSCDFKSSKAPYLVLRVLFLYPFLCAFLGVVLS